jgi:TolB protein
MKAIRVGVLALLALTTSAVIAATVQPGTPAATVIALPPMTTPDSSTKGNESLAYAWQATQLIEADLRQTTELMPLSPNQKDYYSYPEVTAPTFSKWRDRGAKSLITGFVQQRPDGRLTVGCYVYDVDKGRELGRIGFLATPKDLRRAAHKCSGLAYKAITGSPGMFDTRIAYVAETGPADARVKRIAVMDSDGYNHGYVTPGGTTVLTPRLSPKGAHLAYVSFQGGVPQVRVVDLDSNQQRPLVPGNGMTFAPRYSPDGSQIVFSMMLGANSDIYVVNANGGMPRRLTTSPGIDTDPSFSPDGSKIVFESDRAGTQQLYVMNADGSNPHRITFGPGTYSTPVWSPRGDLIAFTRQNNDLFAIGVIKPDGSGERILTEGFHNEGPTWAPNGRVIMFFRNTPGANGGPQLWTIDLNGYNELRIPTPAFASDPAWSPLIN